MRRLTDAQVWALLIVVTLLTVLIGGLLKGAT